MYGGPIKYLLSERKATVSLNMMAAAKQISVNVAVAKAVVLSELDRFFSPFDCLW